METRCVRCPNVLFAQGASLCVNARLFFMYCQLYYIRTLDNVNSTAGTLAGTCMAIAFNLC